MADPIMTTICSSNEWNPSQIILLIWVGRQWRTGCMGFHFMYRLLLNEVMIQSINESKQYISYWINRIYSYLVFSIDGLVQDCGNSSAHALELLQSCTKPSIYCLQEVVFWTVVTTVCKRVLFVVDNLWCIPDCLCCPHTGNLGINHQLAPAGWAHIEIPREDSVEG